MQNKFRLDGKHLLITGASGGIGSKIAMLSDEMGARLTLSGRNNGKLEKLLKSLQGKGHQIIAADICKEEDRKALAVSLTELDGVVYAAGITAHMPAAFINHSHLQTIFSINFESVVLLTALLLHQKKIREKGSIVFLSSVASRLSYFGGTAYSSSKAALESYMRTLAVELAPRKIRSNALAPSFVETEMIEQAEKTISTEAMEKMRSIHPLGFGKTEDVAHAAVFLLSDASSWITGESIGMGGLQ